MANIALKRLTYKIVGQRLVGTLDKLLDCNKQETGFSFVCGDWPLVWIESYSSIYIGYLKFKFPQLTFSNMHKKQGK